MKILAVDPRGTWARSCRDAARRAGHVIEIGTELPSADQVHAMFAEAIILPWAGRVSTGRWMRQLRTEVPSLPMLVLIDPIDPASVSQALDAGANEGLLLPVRCEELMLRLIQVQAVLAQGKPGILHLADLQLDLVQRQALRGRQPVQLTAVEWRIVELLAADRGPFIGAQVIADVLPKLSRGSEACQDSRVSVHISHLRRKLGAASIESRRGMGYRLAQ